MENINRVDILIMSEYLRISNPEIEDTIFEFNEEDHEYFICFNDMDKIKIKTSVTSLISCISHPFEKDKMLDNTMKKLQKYEKHLKSACIEPEYTGMTEEEISELWDDKPKYHGMTREEISELWDNNGENARNIGTEVHKWIEDLYNKQDMLEYDKFSEVGKSVINFLDFHNSLPKYYVPYRTEFIVSSVTMTAHSFIKTVAASSEIKTIDHLKLGAVEHFETITTLAGMIDMIYLDTRTNTYVLCDWKNCKPISKIPYGKRYKTPMGDIKHSTYNKYKLQLNLYRHIFELGGSFRYDSLPNRKVSEMWLVNLKGDGYVKYNIRRLDINPLLDNIKQIVENSSS